MGARAGRGIRNSQIGITSKNVLLLCERKKRTQIVSTASFYHRLTVSHVVREHGLRGGGGYNAAICNNGTSEELASNNEI
jgi:hypothetical protein